MSVGGLLVVASEFSYNVVRVPVCNDNVVRVPVRSARNSATPAPVEKPVSFETAHVP